MDSASVAHNMSALRVCRTVGTNSTWKNGREIGGVSTAIGENCTKL